ncbi:MAG: cation diffusion facilitator family transporter [Sphingobacterium sp.]|uniref:cation diffusion facilitator family transporter n=1 Tax=Sphingobacterium sp. JB170 TaxID=1434842 RepID=UPI00097F1785|nr:cation diffusion facilitator family transporter [Sphingobacterium sp. JB170]SJN48300.1 Cobalt-zinc-cadmium resistance protein [Sphingobacterium sp. JB170]
MSNADKAIRTTYFSILTNFLLALVKWLAGILGNSYALIADAIESTADIFSSILVLLGLRYSKRPADETHPYGHGRIEPLITFIVVIFLIVSAFVIAMESIENIRTPHDLPESWTLIVLAAIIIWKELSFRTIIKKSKALNSNTLKAEAWHHRADAITSVAAFIGISVALFSGPGYESADDWAALFASGLIIYNCYGIFRPALAEIMDENTYEELEEIVRKKSINVEGVKLIEKCYIRKIGMYFQIDLHAVVDPTITVREGHEIAHNLKDYLMDNVDNIGNVFIHIEPFERTELKRN